MFQSAPRNLTFMYRSICLFAALAISAPLSAAPVDRPPPELEALVKSADYQKNVARLFALIPPEIFQRCPALVSNGSTVTISQPVNFAADGYPISGQWKQSFPVKGCGNDTTINLFFQGQPNERIGSVVGIAGATHAGLVLQRDAWRYAVLAVQPASPKCANIHVRDTSYDGSGTGKRERAWRETWTVVACGHVFQVPLEFIPDATGTVISAQVATPVGP